MNQDTRELYNQTAQRWQRREPNSLSDFTARPRVFDLCGEVRDLSVVDLGCGEGYCAREIASRGAAQIQGIELSQSMVDLAKSQQRPEDAVIEYRQGNVTDLPYADESFDLAMGVFVYNYLTIQQTGQSFSEVFRVLKPGAAFVFSVPHPAFPFIRADHEAPFYFDAMGNGYFSSRDQQCQGEIHCRDGSVLNVQMIPKSLEDYFSLLAGAGFSTLPQVQEYGVTQDMLELDREFFEPVADVPLHLAFRIIR